MSARRKGGRLRKLDRAAKAKQPRHGGLILARSLDEAVRKTTPPRGRTRYYRGPDGLLIAWTDGRFTLRPAAPAALKALARPPAGLLERVNDALSKGLRHG